MPRGGGASSQRAILFWSLFATPACGLVVGFEPRELCDECASSSAEATSNGGASSAANTTAASSSEGSAAGIGAETTSGGSGGTDASSSGADGDNTDTDTGGTGGTTTDSGGTAGETTSSSTGGTNTDAGGGPNSAGGTTSTDGGGTGGETTSTGGTNTDVGGAGGSTTTTAAGGTTTTAAGGTTTTGGTTTVGGAGGSGGTGGTASPCRSDDPFDVTQSAGAHPAALMIGRNNSSRSWDFSWAEGDDIYVSARALNGGVLLEPKPLDDTGTHSASVIATHSQYAYVAYGEFASGNARIVMNWLNPLDADTVLQDDTGTLAGDAAPRVVGVTHRGSTSDMLVAAIGSDGSGLLALFSDGQFVTSRTVPGSLDDLTPLDLGESFAIAYVEDDSLLVALVSYDLTAVEAPLEVEGASPVAPALGSLGGTAIDNGAALVWREANGVAMITVDEEGAASADPISVAPGNSVLPKVDGLGTQLFVSWIDTTAETLYLQRVPGDLSGVTEQPFAVDSGVAEVSYGFAADPYSSVPTLALVYSTDRLRMSIITCP